MSKDLIRYLAVCRPDKNANEDKHELLGTLLTQKGDPDAAKYKEHTIKIMTKAHKLGGGKRIRLTSDHDYEVHVQCEEVDDTTLLFVAVSDLEFGVHHLVSGFFDDWKSSFYRLIPAAEVANSKGSLSNRVNQVLQAIQKKYNTSSLREANLKAEKVKDIMRDNVDIALANAPKLDEMDQKSAEIEQSSRTFESKARDLKCAMCKQYWKATLLIALIIIIILVIIIVVATR